MMEVKWSLLLSLPNHYYVITQCNSWHKLSSFVSASKKRVTLANIKTNIYYTPTSATSGFMLKNNIKQFTTCNTIDINKFYKTVWLRIFIWMTISKTNVYYTQLIIFFFFWTVDLNINNYNFDKSKQLVFKIYYLVKRSGFSHFSPLISDKINKSNYCNINIL